MKLDCSRGARLAAFLLAISAIGTAAGARDGYAGSTTSDAASSAPGASVELVSSHPLAHVPGKAVTMVRVTYPPGGMSSAHRHAGAVSVYVISGAVRSKITGEAERVYKAGESFFEPPGVRHMVSANASDREPAEILAVFVAEEKARLTVFDE